MSDNSANSGCLNLAGIGLLLLALMMAPNLGAGGVLVLIIAGIVLLVVAQNESATATQAPKQSNQGAAPVAPKLTPVPHQNLLALQLMVSTKEEKLEDLTINLLKFHTKGFFDILKSIARPCFEIRLSDVTDAADCAPVLCVMDELQDEDSTEYRFHLILRTALNPGSGSMNWVELASVPKELLVFPKSGSRRIKATFRVTDAANGRLVNTAETVFSTTVEGAGYLEDDDEESEAQAASLQLAMCIAAADGSVDGDEVEVIKAWGVRTVNALPTGRQATRRSRLNEALQTATREIRANRVSVLQSNAVEVLKGKGSARFFYDTYELCLHVVKADGEAHPEEMACLTRLARSLGLDEAKVRILNDRCLANVEFASVEDESGDDHIIGITEDMSKDQIRKHLNKLYQKHQARTQHDNPDVIAKAKDWLDRIARARVRHLGN
jgi:tellurite resistance protein